MKRTITQSDFIDAFRDYGREDQFSYEALCALFEFFDDLDEQCDTETELDVIAICCEFSEEPWKDIADNYSIDLTDCEDDDDKCNAVGDYLQDNTMLVGGTNAGNDYLYISF